VTERLTVAIPYHAGLRYLALAIESALAQTRAPAAILVSDDGETPEETARLVAGYGDPRLRHERATPGRGMVANWNRCLDRAGTELVTLLHADDLLLPDYCARMEDAAARTPGAAALFCDARIIDGEGRPRFSFPDWVKTVLAPRGTGPLVLVAEPGLALLLRGNLVMCPTLCYRRAVVGGRRFDPRWRQVQDLAFVTALLLEGESLVGLRGASYAYRRHVESATHVQSENLLRFDEEIALYDELAGTAAARGWEAAAGVARGKTIIRLHLGFQILRDLLRLRVGAIPRKVRRLLGRGGSRGRSGTSPPSGSS
jgi:glycosyltransferase involved in cell wall biosynthesis